MQRNEAQPNKVYLLGFWLFFHMYLWYVLQQLYRVHTSSKTQNGGKQYKKLNVE